MRQYYEPSPCPTCGGQSKRFVYVERDGSEDRFPAQRCGPCYTVWTHRHQAFVAGLELRCPDLSARVRNAMCREFETFGDIDGLLAASDDDLLAIRNFGRRALAEFRAAVPVRTPQAGSRPSAPHGPDAVVSAEAFWAARPAVLAVIGG
jgi:hypothetical protein